MNTNFDLAHCALLWGPGVVVLAVFSYSIGRLAQYWIARTVELRRKQMDSMFELAHNYVDQFVTAQKSQADAFSRLATTVERSDSQDSFEHQEILIAIKSMHHDIEDVRQSLRTQEAIGEK
jgi:hypothetical protein